MSRAISFIDLCVSGQQIYKLSMNQSELMDILKLPIANSPLSHEFKMVTEILGFHIFSDLLQYRTVELLNLSGFTQHLIYEYVQFLETNKMGHMIDP